MDQMASTLGQQQALMAMACQPAEVEPPVPIPSHLKFWGLDSGPTLLARYLLHCTMIDYLLGLCRCQCDYLI